MKLHNGNFTALCILYIRYIRGYRPHHLLAAVLEFGPKCIFHGFRHETIFNFPFPLVPTLYSKCGPACGKSYFVLFFSTQSASMGGLGWGAGGGKVNGSLAPLNSRSTFWAGFILGTRCVMNTFLLPFNCGHLQQCYSNGGGIIASLTRKSKRPSQSRSQMDSLKLMRLTVGMSPLCDRRLKGERHFCAVSIGGAQNNSKCRRRGKVVGLGGVVVAGGRTKAVKLLQSNVSQEL